MINKHQKTLIQHSSITKKILCNSFEAFIRVMHTEFRKNECLILRDFQKEIIHVLQKSAFGELKKNKIMINITPRFGKSMIAKYYVAWGYVLNKYSNFIYTSYSDKLVQDFSNEIKTIMSTRLYSQIFSLSFDKNQDSKGLRSIEAGGSLRSVSQGGAITGFGAGIAGHGFGGALIIDDPIKPTDVSSKIARQSTIDYYELTLQSRLNNRQETPIIVIAQRLHPEDLCGYLLNKYGDDWIILNYPCFNEKTNKSIWEEKYPSSQMQALKISNPFFFHSQLHQKPIMPGGNLIKEDCFTFYESYETEKFNKIFITTDTAMAKTQHADYTVFAVWGSTDSKLFLLDMIRGKWSGNEILVKALEVWEKWRHGVNKIKCNNFIIENKVTGTGLIYDLQKMTCIPVTPLERTKDKVQRVHDVLPYIFARKVCLPRDNNKIKSEVIEECTAFSGNGTHLHDDIVDCLVDAIVYAFNAGTKLSWMDINFENNHLYKTDLIDEILQQRSLY